MAVVAGHQQVDCSLGFFEEKSFAGARLKLLRGLQRFVRFRASARRSPNGDSKRTVRRAMPNEQIQVLVDFAFWQGKVKKRISAIVAHFVVSSTQKRMLFSAVQLNSVQFSATR